ncbi:MAG: VWA domain-containing protein, partial [Candidatus Saccharibacteria bacterium]
MLERLERFFSNRRNVIIVASLVGALLVIAIGLVVALLIGNNTPKSSSSSSDEGNSLSSGNVSDLTGSTSSYRNLKGLTLRINQIETCNPSVVSAYVAVSSEAGVVNKNFSKKDVEVYLDNKRLNTFDFNSVDTTKTPLTNVLLIDHSGSMRGDPMENAKSAATNYIQNLKSGDQVGVVQFDDRIEVLQNVSTDKATAAGAVSQIQPRGDTALFDGLDQAISLTPDCGRKAVTVLTDGDDTASKNNTTESVINAANKANLPIFSVGVNGEGFNPSAIKQISESTGGQYLEANTPTEISQLYSNINGQLTGQFVANLKLSLKKNGSSHTLKIVSTIEGSPTSSERSFIY